MGGNWKIAVQKMASRFSFFPTEKKAPLTMEQKIKELHKNSGVLSIIGSSSPVDSKMLAMIDTLGYGIFGTVTKRCYEGTTMAVKSIFRTVDDEKTFRALMDLDVVMKSNDCPQIVRCYGYFILNTEVLICMECMETCLDKLIRKVVKGPIPEDIIGQITVSVIKALRYLKEQHKILHRDIKPSNILLDREGNVKLCDFGMCRQLVDSFANSLSGCEPYMAPERLSSPDKPYGIRSDVWSLGVTLMELANGKHPYLSGTEQASPKDLSFRVMYNDPPRLSTEDGFSKEFCHFIKQCLQNNVEHRPKYDVLSTHSFVTYHESQESNVKEWIANFY